MQTRLFKLVKKHKRSLSGHEFKFLGVNRETGRKDFKVKCLSTGGTFSVQLWREGVVSQGQCMICKQQVRR